MIEVKEGKSPFPPTGDKRGEQKADGRLRGSVSDESKLPKSARSLICFGLSGFVVKRRPQKRGLNWMKLLLFV